MRYNGAEHLNQAGVSLARMVGENIGPFDRVATSSLPRAFETAIAMGFAVDEQNPLLSTYGPQVGAEAPWPMPFYHFSEVIKRKGPAQQYALQLKKYYEQLVEQIAEGRSALVINHGGVLELGVTCCLPDTDFMPWGDEVDYCEGARLYWEDDEFIRGEVLRVSR